jgi:hypothetical protein
MMRSQVMVRRSPFLLILFEGCDYAHRGYRLKVMLRMTMARERRYAEGIAN